MDIVAPLVKGLVIGLSIAAPVGPIGLLCIRRTLADGPVHGLATGLGAASADAVYGAIAGFGLSAVSDWLIGREGGLRLFGGLMLLWMGIATLRARPAPAAAGPAVARAVGDTGGLLRAYGSTFMLTLANPATILSFVAVFGALGLAGPAGATHLAVALVTGVFLGSALWWLGLSTGVGAVRHRVTPAAMVWINRASGAVLAGFGLTALASLLA
ncbi:LysE/ArgO family amino acid transporter [Azospirillum halopraeferens]|uniref:LysE/ArgO family amino acid transporter n=1 Tax=Azospirillum halopraeferens TaxID=34010 RepID=UPI0003FF05A3|nr:LysE family transporter [Azospirillum halopraeferens]